MTQGPLHGVPLCSGRVQAPSRLLPLPLEPGLCTLPTPSCRLCVTTIALYPVGSTGYPTIETSCFMAQNQEVLIKT